MLLLLLLACEPTAPQPSGPTPVTTPDLAGPAVVVLSPTEHLIRASMALRGIRPSLDELDAVEANPGALPLIVDAYLDSPELGDVIREAHGVWWLTETYRDYYPGGFYAFGSLSDFTDNEVNISVQEGPGRLAEHVVSSDLPYSEVVLADYMLADDIVSRVWGLPYDAAAGGWQVSRFEDGRPMSGLLTEPWYFVRHASTETNRQRARAGHLSRALLCHDYMGREVRVPEDVDLTEGGDNAIEQNPVCVSCHHTLDPLGAFFAPHEGVVVPQLVWRYPIDTWDARRTADYDTPRYYGEPATDLQDLAGLIADDPRFARCAVRRFYGELLGRDAEAVSPWEVDRFLPHFLDSGMRVKPLLREIVLSDVFAAASPADASVDADGLIRATPWQVARTIEDLTGESWTIDIPFGFYGPGPGPTEAVDDITWGYRTLGGGPDGFERWNPLRTVDPTTVLVHQALLAHTVPQAVSSDLAAAPVDRRLLTLVGPEDDDEDRIREQLVVLHRRLYGTRVALDDPAIDDGHALWAATLAASGEVSRAWHVTLTALLSDPRLLLY